MGRRPLPKTPASNIGASRPHAQVEEHLLRQSSPPTRSPDALISPQRSAGSPSMNKPFSSRPSLPDFHSVDQASVTSPDHSSVKPAPVRVGSVDVVSPPTLAPPSLTSHVADMYDYHAPAEEPYNDPLMSMDDAYGDFERDGLARSSYSTMEGNRKVSYADLNESSLHLGMPPILHDAEDAPFLDSESMQGWVQRQQRPENGHTRQVHLTEGNWIVDYPVPTPISNAVEPMYREQGFPKEFTHLRYSAVTCDPDEFTSEHGWGLRTSSEYRRSTELLITLTYYNEDRNLLTRTLYSVMQNIRDICKHRTSRYWQGSEEDGQPAWQKIVVSLVFDGIDPCDKETLDVLATIGVYQDGLMKREVNGKETVAHIFEYTTQISVDSTPKLVQPVPGQDSNLVPVQMIFCFKQKNSKKINSHRWVFHALGRMLQPEIVVLIDVGTKPGTLALYHLWEAFYNNPNLGGACGEIHAMIKHGIKLVNPLVAAQNFEYKISNILDKPLESTFGYVSVLPGAFSAYRYRAVTGRPLEQYFHGDHTLAEKLGNKGITQMNIFKKNMFLAEDRILCFELVAKAGDQWILSYVKPSKAETDVPEHTAELISQRRRWLNGSFAASIYSLVHFVRFYKSGHGFTRMFFFHVQALYNLIQLILSWFALANLWLTFAIIIQYLPSILLRQYGDAWLIAFHYVNLIFMWLYAFFLALQFVLALGNRPKSEHLVYALSFAVFGFLGLYVIVISLWLTAESFASMHPKNGDYADVVLSNTTAVLIASLAAMFGIYLIASLLYADPWHMLTSSVQYTLMAPSFVNVINVYAFCNLHDVSWGTKGADKADALPSVGPAQSCEQADTFEEAALSQEELDTRFQDVVSRAMSPYHVEHEKSTPTMDDGNRTFRTRLVALWLLTNAFLVALIMNLYDYQPHAKLDDEIYFKVILWSTFSMALFRFIGCLVFWIRRQSTKWFVRS
ncbi:chitin synthase [Malassezia pachydermatis]|uniref:Chitin synthase n=1 Tax=Malassezia pachydermatis TaxID=77020 RepID=A0A0M8MLL8_9BASI|nr:chitin synthase [Malassezia pachydermatis]KOS14038.1 chitin synthase [Malassezia pachydermatis]